MNDLLSICGAHLSPHSVFLIKFFTIAAMAHPIGCFLGIFGAMMYIDEVYVDDFCNYFRRENVQARKIQNHYPQLVPIGTVTYLPEGRK